jgi:alpha-tubulin suppressor-like RCC1 family protein
MRRALLALAAVALLSSAAAAGAQPSPPAEIAPEAALVGITQVAAGNAHTCALLSNHQARCWGKNDDGQLGTGDNAGSPTAVTVRNTTDTGPLTGIVQIVAGNAHTCALLAGHQVRCWGDNFVGELGNGTDDDSALPVAVKAVAGPGRLRNVTQITAGDEHTCARLASGQARCWGYNGNSQLGEGTDEDRYRPVAVRNVTDTGPLTGVAQIDGGSGHTCARLSNRQARCWGTGLYGEIGRGSHDEADFPAVVLKPGGVGPLTGVVQISAGWYHSCARLAGGQARCWGLNEDGQVGNGGGGEVLLPTPVSNGDGTGRLRAVTRIEAGGSSSCATVRTGGRQVRCWGANTYGQLGIGVTGPADRTRPVEVLNTQGTGPLTDATGLALTAFHSCVRRSSGRAVCWGAGTSGQLGDGSNANHPFPVFATS